MLAAEQASDWMKQEMGRKTCVQSYSLLVTVKRQELGPGVSTYEFTTGSGMLLDPPALACNITWITLLIHKHYDQIRRVIMWYGM